MKERPILFQAPMVRAILDGTKTQTRRAMRYQPGDETSVHVERFNQTVVDRHGDEQPGPEIFGAWWDDGESGLACPFGAPGERLWVRETWQHGLQFDVTEGLHRVDRERYYYRADYIDGQGIFSARPWRPSIFMPRGVSRIQLQVTAVRVERLQSISAVDALAEGSPRVSGCNPQVWYRGLWDTINATKPEARWAANPWVWCIEFKRAA